ncbi:MAG: Uncharacterized protein G01um101448_338 [Parcubacteria group bacterium Gr01-1014_48]|nr:MAG: Uncharacterized protein Greene041614_1077 [Parcubacteria group bacterium Greene0416_14]TSC74098.1 MAG: Uncharacterized protein G01um101448_338 [Parcubacteria group bacterium Gr01-1014_48]TSD00132.1 MAG: Uncharacterized protein Greene101415_959 [Parcubacteria group bacterium Greene1014_15]TSD07713.1 MAG: Uncharacterized protein Greene07144_807 [Parcubacteria group bacterium Greene0714_4]
MFVVALAAIVLLTRGASSTKVITNNPAQFAPLVAIAQKALSSDSDNDGLPDWEETLRKTDPNNKDSDKDGIPDGKERFEDLSINARVEKTLGEFDSKGLTATERFGRELLMQYIELKKEGKPFGAAETEKFVQKLTKEVDKNASVALYSIRDFHISDITGTDALKEYASRMGRIIIRNTPAGLENEIVVATRALENSDPGELQKIKPLIASFENSIQESLSVAIPRSIAPLHIDLINSFSYMKTTLGGLELIFDDPLTSFVRITQHQQSVGALNVALANMSSFLETNNVEFNETDEGGVFVTF